MIVRQRESIIKASTSSGGGSVPFKNPTGNKCLSQHQQQQPIEDVPCQVCARDRGPDRCCELWCKYRRRPAYHKSELINSVLVSFVQKWNRPPRYSSESISTSVSSEEYHGGSLPPLQLSGVPLPSPVHANSVGTPTYTTFTPRPNTLSSPHFAELVKFNAPLINQSVGGNQQ